MSRVRKSVLEELAIIESKILIFLDFVQFGFLNLVNFAMVDRFSIPPPTQIPPMPSVILPYVL